MYTTASSHGSILYWFYSHCPTLPVMSYNVVYNVVCIYNNRSETDAEDSDESDSDMTTAEC